MLCPETACFQELLKKQRVLGTKSLTPMTYFRYLVEFRLRSPNVHRNHYVFVSIGIASLLGLRAEEVTDNGSKIHCVYRRSLLLWSYGEPGTFTAPCPQWFAQPSKCASETKIN